MTVATIHQRLPMSTAWTRAWPACAAGCGRTCPRTPGVHSDSAAGQPPPGAEALCGIPHKVSYETSGTMRRRAWTSCRGKVPALPVD